VSEHKSSEFGTAVSGLIAVVFLIAVVYTLTAGQFASMSADPGSPQEIAARLAPVGSVNLVSGDTAKAAGTGPAPAAPQAAAAAPAEASDGAQIFDQACSACHTTGVAGAPMLGDQAAWEPRIAQGMDGLMHTAINGKGAMPPRGTCATCTDDDLRAAIEYMISKVQ
jgi:cytochrome c5